MRIRLKEVRERRLLTQRELAVLAAIPHATISRIETGKQEPRVTTVRKLAKALKVEPEELIITSG